MNAKAPPYDGAGLWVESANFPVQKLKPLKVMINISERQPKKSYPIVSSAASIIAAVVTGIIAKIMENDQGFYLTVIIGAAIFVALVVATAFFLLWELYYKLKQSQKKYEAEVDERFKREVDERFKREVDERFKREVDERFKREVDERFSMDFDSMDKAKRDRNLMIDIHPEIHSMKGIPEEEKSRNVYVHVWALLQEVHGLLSGLENKIEEVKKANRESMNDIRTSMAKADAELDLNLKRIIYQGFNALALKFYIESLASDEVKEKLEKERLMLPGRLREFVNSGSYKTAREFVWNNSDLDMAKANYWMY